MPGATPDADTGECPMPGATPDADTGECPMPGATPVPRVRDVGARPVQVAAASNKSPVVVVVVSCLKRGSL